MSSTVVNLERNTKKIVENNKAQADQKALERIATEARKAEQED